MEDRTWRWAMTVLLLLFSALHSLVEASEAHLPLREEHTLLFQNTQNYNQAQLSQVVQALHAAEHVMDHVMLLRAAQILETNGTSHQALDAMHLRCVHLQSESFAVCPDFEQEWDHATVSGWRPIHMVHNEVMLQELMNANENAGGDVLDLMDARHRYHALSPACHWVKRIDREGLVAIASVDARVAADMFMCAVRYRQYETASLLKEQRLSHDLDLATQQILALRLSDFLANEELPPGGFQVVAALLTDDLLFTAIMNALKAVHTTSNDNTAGKLRLLLKFNYSPAACMGMAWSAVEQGDWDTFRLMTKLRMIRRGDATRLMWRLLQLHTDLDQSRSAPALETLLAAKLVDDDLVRHAFSYLFGKLLSQNDHSSEDRRAHTDLFRAVATSIGPEWYHTYLTKAVATANRRGVALLTALLPVDQRIIDRVFYETETPKSVLFMMNRDLVNATTIIKKFEQVYNTSQVTPFMIYKYCEPAVHPAYQRDFLFNLRGKIRSKEPEGTTILHRFEPFDPLSRQDVPKPHRESNLPRILSWEEQQRKNLFSQLPEQLQVVRKKPSSIKSRSNSRSLRERPTLSRSSSTTHL